MLAEHLVPLDRYRELRKSSPLQYDEKHGSWNVYKYDDVKQVLADYETFSSQMRKEPPPDEPIESSLLRKDPPKHRQMRALVSQAFTPRAVQSMTPLIEAVADDLLDQAATQGEFEAVQQFAAPLPVRIIADMLGIPPEHRDLFQKWSEELVGSDTERFQRCQREMSEYFAKIVEKRRIAPGDDLISRLTAAAEQHDTLSGPELIGFCILLLVAGNETTSNLISSALLCLDSDINARARLLAHPASIPDAVEEIIRYCSPVQHTSRKATKDTELRGQRITAGQTVNLCIVSANHDEERFIHPERFDIARNPNPHLAFGHGIHFCLGALLARIEASIAIRALLNRFPSYARDRSYELEKWNSWIVFGVKRLPLLLRPGH
jgi:cytochrome P450